MVRLEVFSGDPPCPGCVAIIDLAKRVEARYDGELELTIHEGAAGMEKFEEYRLFCVPAAVVNGTIRVEGICPSEATLNNALRGGGYVSSEDRGVCVCSAMFGRCGGEAAAQGD